LRSNLVTCSVFYKIVCEMLLQTARWDIRHHIYEIWKIYHACKTCKTENKSRENSLQLNVRKGHDVGHLIIPIYTTNIAIDKPHLSKVLGYIRPIWRHFLSTCLRVTVTCGSDCAYHTGYWEIILSCLSIEILV
jgi:hypothetical protein